MPSARRGELQMHEPYRTLLGHFRHEIGHYYWDRLIQGTDRIDGFRQLFGDERQDYGQALHRHHQQGAPVDWANRSSPPTPAPIPGRTGPRPGPITCT